MLLHRELQVLLARWIVYWTLPCLWDGSSHPACCIFLDDRYIATCTCIDNTGTADLCHLLSSATLWECLPSSSFVSCPNTLSRAILCSILKIYSILLFCLCWRYIHYFFKSVKGLNKHGVYNGTNMKAWSTLLYTAWKEVVLEVGTKVLLFTIMAYRTGTVAAIIWSGIFISQELYGIVQVMFAWWQRVLWEHSSKVHTPSTYQFSYSLCSKDTLPRTEVLFSIITHEPMSWSWSQAPVLHLSAIRYCMY